jgi:hypothetical protein
MPVTAAGDSGGGGPVPVLAISLIALLWVWIFDGAMQVSRLRKVARGRGLVRNAGCRCRVCTLRTQARGQPLHDVGDGGVRMSSPAEELERGKS